MKSTIDRVVAKLEGKHWMYAGSSRPLDVIKMCEDCRVAFVAKEGFEPYGAPSQTVRTTDDYLRERELISRRFQSLPLLFSSHTGTTGNFSLWKVAKACGSSFRCAFTSSGGVNANHWFSETSA